MLVLIGCSVVSPPMYVTDEAEDNKVCPADYLDAILKADDEIQEEVLIPPMVITDINHPEYVAPAKCHSFYRNSDEQGEEPIWFGRVQNLQAENQNLYINGYVTQDTAVDFTLEYEIHIRGSMAWKNIGSSKATQEVSCVPTSKKGGICD